MFQVSRGEPRYDILTLPELIKVTRHHEEVLRPRVMCWHYVRSRGSLEMALSPSLPRPSQRGSLPEVIALALVLCIQCRMLAEESGFLEAMTERDHSI